MELLHAQLLVIGTILQAVAVTPPLSCQGKYLLCPLRDVAPGLNSKLHVTDYLASLGWMDSYLPWSVGLLEKAFLSQIWKASSRQSKPTQQIEADVFHSGSQHNSYIVNHAL